MNLAVAVAVTVDLLGRHEPILPTERDGLQQLPHSNSRFGMTDADGSRGVSYLPIKQKEALRWRPKPMMFQLVAGWALSL
jgi:hypothetical protein